MLKQFRNYLKGKAPLMPDCHQEKRRKKIMMIRNAIKLYGTEGGVPALCQDAEILKEDEIMGYSIKRVDQNQRVIVERFRALGARVAVLSSVGHGMCDLLVGIPKLDGALKLLLIEIKDGKKPPSHRRLTFDEKKFHNLWEGAVHIVKDEGDVDLLVDWVRG